MSAEFDVTEISKGATIILKYRQVLRPERIDQYRADLKAVGIENVLLVDAQWDVQTVNPITINVSSDVVTGSASELAAKLSEALDIARGQKGKA